VDGVPRRNVDVICNCVDDVDADAKAEDFVLALDKVIRTAARRTKSRHSTKSKQCKLHPLFHFSAPAYMQINADAKNIQPKWTKWESQLFFV
jgi:hypothetical protein